jgi:hypothetical protein
MKTILAFAIILILVLLVLFMYKGSPQVSHFTAEQPLVCRSPENIAEAKNYYDNVGEYHGVFVMDPISSYQAGPTSCDVKYKYIPTPDSPRNDSLVDARRFEYRNVGGKWKVVNMLDWKSGVLNM